MADWRRREDDLLDEISRLLKTHRDRIDFIRTVLTVMRHNAPREIQLVIDHLLAEM